MSDIIQQNKRNIINTTLSLLVVGGFVGGFLLWVEGPLSAQSFRDTDLNQDGVVDQADVELLRTAFDSQDLAADFNNNGTVDTYDLFLFNQDYGDGDSENRDFDEDGYRVAHMDCDDLDNRVHPYRLEEENGMDDNCNGLIDEFIDQKPVTTNEWYEVPVEYVRASGGELVVSVKTEGIKLFNFDEQLTNTRGVGRYAFILKGVNGELVDTVTFGSGFELIDRVGSIEGGDVLAGQDDELDYVYIPKHESIDQVYLRDLFQPESAVDDLPLDQYQLTSLDVYNSPQNQPQWLPCPSTIRPDSDGLFGIAWCQLYGTATEEDLGAIIENVEDIVVEAPELLALGLHKLTVVGSGFEARDACGFDSSYGPIGGCYRSHPNQVVAQSYEDSDDTLLLMVHELAHKFHRSLLTEGHLVLDLDDPEDEHDWEFVERAMMFAAAEINLHYCDLGSEDCEFNPMEFYDGWYNEHDPQNPGAWRAGCDYVTCSENQANVEWKDVWYENPLEGGLFPLNMSSVLYTDDSYRDDTLGPRPFNLPGVVSAYGAKNSLEGFATFYESLYLERISPGGHLGEAVSLCRIASRHLETNASTDDKVLSLSGLGRAVKLFAKYGFIDDSNSNGIPDQCDTPPEPVVAYCGGTPPRRLESGEIRGGYHPSCDAPPDSERYQDCLERRVTISSSDPNLKPGCESLIVGGAAMSGAEILDKGCVVSGVNGSPIFDQPQSDLAGMADPPPWGRDGFASRNGGVCGPTVATIYKRNGCLYEGPKYACTPGSTCYPPDPNPIVRVPFSCWYKQGY